MKTTPSDSNIKNFKESQSSGDARDRGIRHLIERFQRLNLYGKFNADQYRYDAQGWNSERETFHEMLDAAQPKLVIEVGTWKGGSAIYMGKYIKAKNLDTKIICVDTWTSDWDFLGILESGHLSNLINDNPEIYRQFIANVIKSDLTDIILPFPQTSLDAADWFKKEGILAELIYLDGSHKETDVYRDLLRYYELVVPGGILFGDDYFSGEPGVVRAVNRFSHEMKLTLEVREHQFWVLHRETKKYSL